MKMSCPGGKVIQVLDASYGRHDPKTCGGVVRTTNCHAGSSVTVVRAKYVASYNTPLLGPGTAYYFHANV